MNYRVVTADALVDSLSFLQGCYCINVVSLLHKNKGLVDKCGCNSGEMFAAMVLEQGDALVWSLAFVSGFLCRLGLPYHSCRLLLRSFPVHCAPHRGKARCRTMLARLPAGTQNPSLRDL